MSLLVFFRKRVKFQTYVYSGCHNVLIIFMNLRDIARDIAIVNINGGGYRCIITRISKSKAVNLLQKLHLNKRTTAL